MRKPKFQVLVILATTLFMVSVVSCTEDEDLFVNITVNEGPIGDIGGDFTGNGGDGTRTINWTNNLTTADYNADITSTASGMFLMTVNDSEGSVVLERGLNGASGPDSFSGVTDVGEPGTWTVTITLTSFNGDGSYSLSEGN